MSRSESGDIVTPCFEQVDMDIQDYKVNGIAALSLGSPRYTHALALNCGRFAIDLQTKRVKPSDLQAAIDVILTDTEQPSYRQFNAATKVPVGRITICRCY